MGYEFEYYHIFGQIHLTWQYTGGRSIAILNQPVLRTAYQQVQQENTAIEIPEGFQQSQTNTSKRGLLDKDHPDFYQHYENVGQFPQTTLGDKQLKTLLVSAFGAVAEPLM